jgi:hypothetical protein
MQRRSCCMRPSIKIKNEPPSPSWFPVRSRCHHASWILVSMIVRRESRDRSRLCSPWLCGEDMEYNSIDVDQGGWKSGRPSHWPWPTSWQTSTVVEWPAADRGARGLAGDQEERRGHRWSKRIGWICFNCKQGRVKAGFRFSYSKR